MILDRISLDHGSGGKLSHDLMEKMIRPAFDNDALNAGDDGAILEMGVRRLAFSTDTFVVDPLFFPGGNIGDLAVNGTVNDLAMCGAVPRYLSAGFVIEEGFSKDALATIVASMRQAADQAGVQIVTGDTKVVPRGAADKLFINTSGIGVLPEPVRLSGAYARPGDRIIVSGTLGDHGAAIYTTREGMAFDTPLTSDTAALNHLVKKMVTAAGDHIHVLRDPTRGGLATSLNEIALQSGTGIRIQEDQVPVKQAVSGICALLGLDPFYLANEGKLIAIVEESGVDTVLGIMRDDSLGRDAAVIGDVLPHTVGKVTMVTRIGGERFLDMLTGDQLPRIC